MYDNFNEGTHFTHDGWAVYNFLNNNLNYTHETHHHGDGLLVSAFIQRPIWKIYGPI